jgi:hypothetical protein
MQIDRATELRDLKMYGALRVHYDKFGTGLKIGTIKLPNFKENNEMFTKTKTTRSDEEILEAIKELAKKHAEKAKEKENLGKYYFFQNADNEYLDLMKEYVSSVSPDREGILTSSLNQIFGKTNKNKEISADNNESLLQQTLKNMEKMKPKNKTANKALQQILKSMDNKTSGATYGKLSIVDDNKLSYVEFYNSNGEMIATYNSTTGWDGFMTKEEQARRSEFLAVYNEAYNSVSQAPEASLPKSVDCGNSFDVVG